MKLDLLTEILSSTDDFIFVTDEKFVVLYASKALLNFIDTNERDFVGSDINDFFSFNEKLSKLQIDTEKDKYVSFKIVKIYEGKPLITKITKIRINDHYNYVFKINKPIKIDDKELKLLSEASADLLEYKNTDDVYYYLSSKLHEITTNCITIVLKYEPMSERMRIVDYKGTGKYTGKIVNLLGRDLIGMKFPISDEGYEVLSTNRLEKGPDDIYTIAEGKIPRFITESLEKIFKFSSLYVMGIKKDNNFLGEIIIIVRKGGFINNPALVETFVRQAGIVLNKKKVDDLLFESEQRYKTIFENNKNIVLLIDIETKKIVNANQSACNFYEYDKDELLSKTLFDISLNEPKLLLSDFKDVINNKKSLIITRHKTKNGKIKDVEVRTGVVELSGKKYLYSSIYDITDMITNKLRLERGEQITNIGNWELDLNTKEVFASEGAKQIYGVNKDKMDYEDILNVPLEKYRESLNTALTELLRDNKPYDIRFKIKRKNDGTIRDIRSIALYDKLRNVVYGSIQDITNIVKIENELIDAKIEAETSNRLKSAFLANLSHEIRTPMNAIKGFAELLKDEDLSPEEFKDYIDIINDNSDQLLTIINDVLDISKIESGNVKLNIEPINIYDLFQKIKSSYLKRFRDKNLEFIVDVKPNIIVRSDKTRIMQILDNLISNSFKFTESGYVKIGFSSSDDRSIMYVEDTGIGIPDVHKEKIFDRFYQIEENYLGKNDGTGLGLAIVKAVVNKLNGDIKVYSNKRGSKFEISFNEMIVEEKTGSNLKNRLINTEKLRDKNILIVEDQDTNYFLIKSMLKNQNCNIDWAKNGKEAIEKINTSNYSIILMDLKMPVMDGFEASAVIKSMKPDLPIIAQSAYVMNEDKEKAFQSHCDDFVTKPIEQDVLINTLIKHL